MIKVIPWQYKALSSFDTIVNMQDGNGNVIGTIRLETEGTTKKLAKRSILGQKEVFVRQNHITIQNASETIKIKATCDTSMSSAANRVLNREVVYKKAGSSQTITLTYHNETVKYFYEFPFNDEIYQLFFDDDGLTFEILKDKSFVAKYQHHSEDKHSFEVESAYEEDCWLWLTLFIHLHCNFNRNRGIVFRGLS